ASPRGSVAVGPKLAAEHSTATPAVTDWLTQLKPRRGCCFKHAALTSLDALLPVPMLARRAARGIGHARGAIPVLAGRTAVHDWCVSSAVAAVPVRAGRTGRRRVGSAFAAVPMRAGRTGRRRIGSAFAAVPMRAGRTGRRCVGDAFAAVPMLAPRTNVDTR